MSYETIPGTRGGGFIGLISVHGTFARVTRSFDKDAAIRTILIHEFAGNFGGVIYAYRYF